MPDNTLSSKGRAENARRGGRWRRKPGAGIWEGKRQRTEGQYNIETNAKRRSRRIEDEEISSDESDANTASDVGEAEEISENPDEARLRTVKQYLMDLNRQSRKIQQVRERNADGLASSARAFDSHVRGSDVEDGGDGDSSGSEDDNDDDDFFLRPDEAQEAAQQLRRAAAAKRQPDFPNTACVKFGSSSFLRGHRDALTCITSPGEGGIRAGGVEGGEIQRKCVYTGSKDCCLIRWDLEHETKQVFWGRKNDFHCGGHFRGVLDVCVAPDESWLVSVGDDKMIRLWDPRLSNRKCVLSLRGHTGSISGIRFNTLADSWMGTPGEVELLTASYDMSLKLWNLKCQACVNTFYGHVSKITCLDICDSNRPLTGGEDCTLRSWKILNDSHLLYPSLGSCVDSVCVMNKGLYLCGTSSGRVALFSPALRKPLHTMQLTQIPKSSCDSLNPRVLTNTGSRSSVSALAPIRGTSSFVSGDEQGHIKLWDVLRSEGSKDGTIIPTGVSASVKGLVNGISFAGSGMKLVAAVSRESRLGRWCCSSDGKNGIQIVDLIHR